MIVWHLSFSPVCKFDWSVTSLLMRGPSVAMAPLFMRGSSVATAPLLMRLWSQPHCSCRDHPWLVLHFRERVESLHLA